MCCSWAELSPSSFITPFKAFSSSFLLSDLAHPLHRSICCVIFHAEMSLLWLLFWITSVNFCCRVAVMSTASHTVGTQPCTAPVAEVRWTQCGCCWRAEPTAASRTTITIPLWWWPRTRKWARRWQRKKTWIIKWTLLKVHLAIMFVSCCFKTAPIVNKRNKVTVNDFLVIIQTFTDCNFMMENHIHLLLELRQNKCKQLQILFDSALVRIAGINGWSHKWKLNVYSSL